MSLENFSQNENNKNYYKKYCQKSIDDMEEKIKQISDGMKTIENSLKDFQDSLKLLNKAIEICKEWVHNNLDIENNINKQHIDNIEKPLKSFNESINNIYSETEKIFDFNNKLDEKYIDLKDFDFFPQNSLDLIKSKSTSNSNNVNINENISFQSNIDNSGSFIKNFNENISILKKENEKVEEKSNYLFKCSQCGKEAILILKRTNKLYCEKCFNIYLDDNKNCEIDIGKDTIYIENFKSEREGEKILFLQSFEKIIKNIILKCNYILENEIIESQNKNNKKDKIFITKIFKYPKMETENVNELDCYINFLKDINITLKNEFNIDNINNDKFEITNKELIDKIKSIFTNEDFMYILNYIDNSKVNLLSSNESGSEEEDIENENFVINEKNINLNAFYYYIHLISKTKNISINLKEIINEIINSFNSNLSVPKNNICIVLNNESKISFIDNLVRTESFHQLSLQTIKNSYPNLNELYEFKEIVDDLSNKPFDLINYIDFSGNFITKKKLYKKVEKGKNEWIGIGLKVLGKYDDGNNKWLTKNSEWAIAYHGVGGKLSPKQVEEKLKNKVKNGITQGHSQTKFKLDDIRHPGKKVGNGVYLTPNLKFLDNFSGIILFNKRKYRVALMVKVKIDKIREPKDINYIWVLNKDYVRAYRILLKKID